MNFTSNNTVYYVENSILTVAFADSKLADPHRYLILQRAVDDDDIYYYEVDSQEFSNEGGIKQAEISDNELQLMFDKSQKIYDQGVSSLSIQFMTDSKLKSYLVDIFKKTGTKLIIN